MRTDIRVKRKEEREKKEKEREELINTILIVSLVFIVSIALLFVVAFVYEPIKVKRLLNLSESLYSSFSFLV